MRHYLGIDPGATGALALVDATGALVDVLDAPIVVVAGKKRISAPLFAAIVRRWTPTIAIVEQVGAMSKQGLSSTFQFGRCAGLVEGVLAMGGIPTEFVVPAVWKRAMRLPADKGAARLMAMRRWPKKADEFELVKNDGKAEAALLAEYLRCQGLPQTDLAV